jgi:hypothetical protein
MAERTYLTCATNPKERNVRCGFIHLRQKFLSKPEVPPDIPEDSVGCFLLPAARIDEGVHTETSNFYSIDGISSIGSRST